MRKKWEGRGERRLGYLNLRFLTCRREARRVCRHHLSSSLKRTRRRFKTERVSHKRGFGSQLLSISSPRCSPSTYSILLSSSLFLSSMFPDKIARGVRRCSSSKGTPRARKRKTSFILRSSTRTSILCVYSIDCPSVFAHPCTYILSPASNLAPSDARLEPHDRSIFPVAPRTRYHRIRSDSRALGLAAFLPFSVLWPFYLSPFETSLLENA